MASVMALISKAVFDGLGKLVLGDCARMDRYVTAGKGLTPLAEGGSLVLVTVRPGERLWLCAILDSPAFEETMWRASPSDVPLTDVTELLPSIRLASGKGIHAPAGKLGMSLQTPRTLAEDDVALLRAAVSSRAKQEKQAPRAEPAKPVVVAAGPDVDALFAEVVSAPDDVDARRVLADRLLEAGDPHGDLIQLSCEAAALPDGDPRRAEIEARAQDLRRSHGLAFSRRLRAVPFFNGSPEGAWAPRFDWDRGFPDQVRGDARDLLPSLEAAAQVSPIRGVHLLDAHAKDLTALAAMPALARVRVLSIRAHETLRGALADLFASPHLHRLERLTLDCPMTQEDVAALERCAALDGVRALALTAPRGPRAPVDGLLRSERCAGITSLVLGEVVVYADTLAGLASLERLELRDLALGATDAKRLAAGAPKSLRSLCLERCDIGGLKGLAALASGPALAEIETFALSGMVTGKFLPPFLDALALPKLASLSLRGSALRADGAKALAASAKKLAALRELELVDAVIKDDGAKAIAALALPRLE